VSRPDRYATVTDAAARGYERRCRWERRNDPPPPRPLTDVEVRLIVMRWADRERSIARRSLHSEANRVRRELGLPTIEGEAIRRLNEAMAAFYAATRATFGILAPNHAARVIGGSDA
jgi:hypothetical protein